ncbi:hypothetical protein C8Q79DRAFT_477739 [Trametes meyenii]|nr:hypothetical protein C8Q79DRAFT_477739 [Trametes meyenii]
MINAEQDRNTAIEAGVSAPVPHTVTVESLIQPLNANDGWIRGADKALPPAGWLRLARVQPGIWQRNVHSSLKCSVCPRSAEATGRLPSLRAVFPHGAQPTMFVWAERAVSAPSLAWKEAHGALPPSLGLARAITWVGEDTTPSHCTYTICVCRSSQCVPLLVLASVRVRCDARRPTCNTGALPTHMNVTVPLSGYNHHGCVGISSTTSHAGATAADVASVATSDSPSTSYNPAFGTTSRRMPAANGILYDVKRCAHAPLCAHRHCY